MLIQCRYMAKSLCSPLLSDHQRRVLESTPGLVSEFNLHSRPDLHCPCPKCGAHWGEQKSPVQKCGTFVRFGDSKIVQRFKCRVCKVNFSTATHSLFRWAKRRNLYPSIYQNACSTMSQRRSSLNLGTSQATVATAIKRMGRIAMREHIEWLFERYEEGKIEEFQFDEMQTHQHTKMKPLSIPMAVAKDRKILGFSVANMGYRAVHKERALQKYGPRKDRRQRGLKQMLQCFRTLLAPQTTVWSDQEVNYPLALERAAPGVQFTHHREPSRKACIVGQGELKSGTRDPLFAINHSCAMVRSSVPRLIRRTWNTTKKRMQLLRHLALYIRYHNMVLTE